MTDLQSFLNPNSVSAPNPSGDKSAFLVLSHRHLPSSLRFGVLRPRTVACFLQCSVPPRGLVNRFLRLGCRRRKQLVVSFAASREEPKHSDIEIDKEKNELKEEAEESEEAWKQTLETFKEQAIKMQGMSQEAYEVYSKKAMEILTKASEKLKIEADKARDDLGKLAKEISEGGTEGYPKPVKDIVGTFSSAEFKEISEVRDFYLGIPYGALLSIGGFLSFMLTGSISAVRFGVILGGALLALSISSLRSWKQRESSAPFLKGQSAIAVIIFIREISLWSLRPSFLTSIKALISGAMVLFYAYRIMMNGQKQGPSLEQGSEN